MKPLVNEVMKLDFTSEERREFSPHPRENRKIRKANMYKNNKKKKSLSKSFDKGKSIKNNKKNSNKIKITEKKETQKIQFQEEDMLQGDNLNPEDYQQMEDIFEDDPGKSMEMKNENKQNKLNNDGNNFSSNSIVDTIKMISKNPERFKYTNKVRQSL
jgi:hypothetical protein